MPFLGYMRRSKYKKINRKIKKVFNSSEKHIIRVLVILLVVFLSSFLVIIFLYNSFFQKFIVENPSSNVDSKLEQDLQGMVKGYPIESMVPEIAAHDKKVAALMISIAKKESNWGKRVPVLDGRDCYNYWGYRGIRDEMGSGGHTCFKNKREAVNIVAKRISDLIYNHNLDSPGKMIIWKCGSDCSGDNPIAVKKWIKDVSYYYNKILE